MQNNSTTKCREIPELSDGDVRRFWGYVQRGEPDECWPWTAARSGAGYGRFKIGKKLYSPHRIAFVLHNGELANLHQYHGTVVRHGCDNPACCNPGHLVAGSQWENVKDMMARGRSAAGQSAIKIPDAMILAIRAATGTHSEIAQRFKLSRSYVSDIRRSRYRKRVANENANPAQTGDAA